MSYINSRRNQLIRFPISHDATPDFWKVMLQLGVARWEWSKTHEPKVTFAQALKRLSKENKRYLKTLY